MKKKLRIIISGGGTGGHIFPAISIANAIRERYPDTEFLFVGADGRMEMEKVPAAGYSIVGLPVRGFDRKNMIRNISVVRDLCRSLLLARKTLRDFRPDVAVGVGGYASGPTLQMASSMGIPTVIQEQNSYAGVTNKLLSKKADAICVAYDGMEKFFPKDKIILTGNPVRQNLLNTDASVEEARAFFGLDPKKKTILVIGGSLGARTINQSIAKGLPLFKKKDVQVIWQTGKNYAEQAEIDVKNADATLVHPLAFIARMDLAYKAADVVISRAGASSISELCLLEKASILVPSPNVAEDHQTKNARALSDKEAAVFISDDNAPMSLVNEALKLTDNPAKQLTLQNNIAKLALHNSAAKIAEIVVECVRRK